MSSVNWRMVMVKSYAPRAAVMVAAAMFLAASGMSGQAAKAKAKGTAAKASFKVSAPDLESKGRITAAHVYNSFGCSGQNISPALNWSNAPAGTKSFAVTAYDPDAPTGSGWWHWVIYNIPASATGLVSDAGSVSKKLAPAGSVQGNTDFGTAGFGGACPPPGHGIHHYQFTVFALK